MENASHTYSTFFSSLLLKPPSAAERGPLARLAREDRVCYHCCRRRLSAKPGGRLRTQRLNGEIRITCGRCLARSKPRPSASTLDEELFRFKRRELELQYERLQRLYGK